MMTRIAISALIVFIALPCPAQGVLLQNRFSPGQTFDAMTDIQMEGDSFLTGEKAATQMRTRMFRSFRIESVDSAGNATIDMEVRRLQTKGEMDDAEFDQDLTGAELERVMFGMHQMQVVVSPQGNVRGGDNLSFQQLGISLPGSLDQTGGFEIPTFPAVPVRVGDCWTKDGQLLRSLKAERKAASDETVYQLSRIRGAAGARTAVIHYRNTSDLSGLGFGTMLSTAQSGGLVIQLEGEILFNIDQGAVISTTQNGTWKLNMDFDTNTYGRQNRTNVSQTMKIQINTQFRWSDTSRKPGMARPGVARRTPLQAFEGPRATSTPTPVPIPTPTPTPKTEEIRTIPGPKVEETGG